MLHELDMTQSTAHLSQLGSMLQQHDWHYQTVCLDGNKSIKAINQELLTLQQQGYATETEALYSEYKPYRE